MRSLRILLMLAAVPVSGLCSDYVQDRSEDLPSRPTMAEIRALEKEMRMPHGAAPLTKYVRYYYSVAQPDGLKIAGIYIAAQWLEPSTIPAGSIAIVAAESDIPVPEDAGCSVVFVEKARGDPSPITTSCAAELIEGR